MINIPKGTKDVLPQDSFKWRYVENKLKETAINYNFKEIRTPIFEYTELFARGVGDTSDVVTKEMYTFLDKGERSITLKPEGTACVVRSFIENGLSNSAMPLKTFYLTPSFRYERPQAGRLREFHQFGVEVFGASGPETDAEVISLANDILDGFNVKTKLFINSIGCPTCRAKYNQALKEFFKPNLSNLCKDCQERYNKNPLRLLDCKDEKCKEINKNAPSILEYLCDDCKSHFESLQKYLNILGIKYEINPKIVRGLDYYTKTVFEFVSTEIGAQGTVLGGGRYDGLIESLGGSPTSAIGFGLGIERLLIVIGDSENVFPKEKSPKLYIATMGDKAYAKAFSLASELRKMGVFVEIDHMSRSIKSQFKYADKINAEYVITLGDDEVASGKCIAKKMDDGSLTEMLIDEIPSKFKE